MSPGNNRPSRFLQLLWLAGFIFIFALWLFPLSNRLTRTAGILLFFLVWFGSIGLVWQRPKVRFGLLLFTGAAFLFLTLPPRKKWNIESVRTDYISSLCRYKGVTYYWGGESPKGIDCSGLIRRGLIDATFLRGIRTLNPSLVRYSLWLWWNDCSAEELGRASKFTKILFSAESLNKLDHARLQPGDMAVTRDGIHILAYLGNNRWIEADPVAEKVLILNSPGKDSHWLDESVNIVRWNIF